MPVYTADTLKPELPNRAVVQGKPYSEWKEMREEDFIFRCIQMTLCTRSIKSGLKFTVQNADSTLEKTRTQTSALYILWAEAFLTLLSPSAARQCLWHPKPWRQTLKTFHKYQVDVLNVFPVHKGNAAEIPLIHQKEAVMSYRCVIVSNPAHISTRSEQLVVETDERHTVPIEDISALMLEKAAAPRFRLPRSPLALCKRNGTVFVR